MPSPFSASVCAVVVTYFPDTSVQERIATIARQVPLVIVVDNTPSDHLSVDLARWGTHVRLIAHGSNLGIAAALNAGMQLAHELGYRWLLTLDQDTNCYPEMVKTLLDVAATDGNDYAVIGSNYMDPRNGKLKTASTATTNLVKTKTVITSGTLVEVSKALMAGGFRTDYFIDQVDHEFCLRMKRHGFRIGITRSVLMTHSVGEDNGARIFFFGAFPGHPAVRKYYITRNSLVTIVSYWRDDPGWCARRLVRLFLGFFLLALFEDDKRRKIGAFCAGAKDAMRNRMGPCPLPELNRRDT